MREITFRTRKYYVAETMTELKKATHASHQPGLQPHHIFGKVGIMRMVVENILYLSPVLEIIMRHLSLVYFKVDGSAAPARKVKRDRINIRG